jgi:membrane-bound lytic murein transglycosylase D
MSGARLLAACAATMLLAGCQLQTPRSNAPTDVAQPATAAPATPPPATPSKPHASRPDPVAPATIPSPAPPPTIVSGGEVIDRLVARLADAPCVEDRVVQRWEKTYGRWAPRFASNVEQILPLIDMVLDELEIHSLPGEFALLPIVESWYRPDAGSRSSAAGMWQFTAGTARHYGLRIVPGFDERLAPRAATRAAMRFLGALQNRFGDWKLANMAFNSGEYRVMKVMLLEQTGAPSAAKHLPSGLSMTTYEHLAKMQALACLIAQPQRFGISLPRAARVERLRAIPLDPTLATLDAVAMRAAIDPARVRALNPGLDDARASARIDGAELLLPASAVDRLLASPAIATSSPAPETAPASAVPPEREYVVRRGDTLGAIARRFQLRLAQLLQWNRLDARALLHPGQRLKLEP